MMGKAAQRKRAKATPTGNIHERIATEARAAQANKPGLREGDETPALDALLASAFNALAARIPSSYEHAGRTYYLKVSIGMARVFVFDKAAADQPIVRGLVGNFAEFGHKPFH